MNINRRAAIAALIGAGLLWGTTVPLSKLALEWLPPGWLTFVRFGLAAMILLIAAPRAAVRAACRPVVLASGAFGYGGSVIVQNAGITRTSVTHAALLIGAVPVLVAIIAALWQHSVARPVAWAGFAVSLAGVGLIAGGRGGGASLGGDGLVLASLLLSATFTVAQVRLLRGRDPIAVTAVQFLGAALAVLPFSAVAEGMPAAPHRAGAVLATVALAVGGTLLPFTLFAYGQSRVSAEIAGAFVNLEPLVGAMAGVVLFGDPVGPVQAAGGAAIIAGIAMSSLPLLGTRRAAGGSATVGPVRVATWNVNSVKQRMPRLLGWLDQRQPDVVCLQETKLADDAFTELLGGELDARGYAAAIHGEARWNGVAILSRAGLDGVLTGIPGAPGFPHPEARAVSATCGGIRVHSVYVPNGRTPDSEHYRYKLAWLAALRKAVKAGPETVMVCGDMNVAPADADVFDPDAYVGQTHVTPPERAALAELQALGLRDIVRDRWPDERVFTYWDYRAGMFHQNLGMRIDLVLASAPVASRVKAAWVDRQARKGTGPSDHAPVIVDLDEAPDGDIGPVVPPPSLRAPRRGSVKLPQSP